MGVYKRTWSKYEDRLLTKAVSHAFLDRGKPVKIKSTSTLWKWIHGEVLVHDPDFMRSISAVRNRWDDIKDNAGPDIRNLITYRGQKDTRPPVPTARQLPLAGNNEADDASGVTVKLITLSMKLSQIDFLDDFALQVQTKTRVKLSRAEIVRALISVMEKAGIETIIETIGAQQ